MNRFGDELGYSVSVTEKEFTEAGWPSDLKNKSSFEVYKVSSNKNGTGILAYGLTCRTFGWSGLVLRLEDLYVVPEYRGQGVGRAVLMHLAKLSVGAGISRLELNSATGAKKFYLELGGRHQSDLTIMQFSRDSIASLAGITNGN
ncbi:thialysine N-epsilon-acetyltransferase-like [Bolinopsis microptera]|uniref:thialysine N-epsilon-acetyltransferase-like n=1 Tax=Bolinopsis microptera TaxID=2820187 RepID=UPI00307A04A9